MLCNGFVMRFTCRHYLAYLGFFNAYVANVLSCLAKLVVLGILTLIILGERGNGQFYISNKSTKMYLNLSF